jgi:hypothetical protein
MDLEHLEYVVIHYIRVVSSIIVLIPLLIS